MNYAEIRQADIADGDGFRVALYVSGCRRGCVNCQNKAAQDFAYGRPFTAEVEAYIINLCKPNYVSGLSILGGEPFEPENQRVLVEFVKRWKRELPKKDVWCWTGAVYETQLEQTSPWRCEVTDDFLRLIDYIVDGPYIDAQRNMALRYRGSSNQRILKLHPKVVDIGNKKPE